MNYKILDLFCGAGGLSLGFQNAGFDIYGGIEWDQKLWKLTLIILILFFTFQVI